MKLFDKHAPQFEQLWANLLKDHANPTALVSRLHLEYRAKYLGRALEEQFSFVVAEGTHPIVGSCFELVHDGAGNRMLTAVDAPSALIVARGLDSAARAGAEFMLRKHLSEIVAQFKVPRVRFIDQLVDGGISTLSHWALNEGATIENQFNQVVDLTKDEGILWRGLTKSCQWSVNWGKKHLIPEVSTDATALNALRELHLTAAGGVTRDPSTWALQGEMLERGEAFVVLAKMDGKVVSAALFQVSQFDCNYSVAASDRTLFDKPLGHSVIWQAMMYAKERGCHRFTLGAQVWQRFRWHLPAPSAKEENISRFKRSFGGDTLPEFLVDLPIRASTEASANVPLYDRDRVIDMATVVPEALKDRALSHGPSVMLRPLTVDDISTRYLEWFAAEVVTQFLEVRTISHDEAAGYIREGLTSNKYFMFAVCDRHTGLHIGNLKIGPIRWSYGLSDLVTVIGDRSYWGKGIATEAIRLGMQIAFRVLGIRKLHGSIVDGNIGSIRAYTRAGWHVEGRLKDDVLVDNHPVDRVLVSAFNPYYR